VNEENENIRRVCALVDAWDVRFGNPPTQVEVDGEVLPSARRDYVAHSSWSVGVRIQTGHTLKATCALVLNASGLQSKPVPAHSHEGLAIADDATHSGEDCVIC